MEKSGKCVPALKISGKNQGIRLRLETFREISGHSTNAGNIQGNIRAFD